MPKVQRIEEVLWEQCKEEAVAAMGKFSTRAIRAGDVVVQGTGRWVCGCKIHSELPHCVEKSRSNRNRSWIANRGQ